MTRAWTDDWGNWSWTDSSWTASRTPSTQESMVPTLGTGPRPTAESDCAELRCCLISTTRHPSDHWLGVRCCHWRNWTSDNDCDTWTWTDRNCHWFESFWDFPRNPNLSCDARGHWQDSLSKIHDDCVSIPAQGLDTVWPCKLLYNQLRHWIPSSSSRWKRSKFEECHWGSTGDSWTLGDSLQLWQELSINYYVCNDPFCIVSVARMLLQGYWTILGVDCSFLLTPNMSV